GGNNTSHTPVVRISMGEWWNKIPYCTYEVLAQSHAYPHNTEILIASFCVAPRGDFLSPKLQREDTRSDPWQVNSYDLACGELHKSLTTLPKEFMDGPLPPILGENRRLRLHELTVTPTGLVSPALGGDWLKTNIGEVNHIVILGNARILDPLLYLPPAALTALSEPIRFGEGFGEAESPADTFVEFLRVLRKAGRYGEMAKDERTEEAFAIIKGKKKIGGRRFCELLKEKTGEREGWQFEATRELATALFYAPRELIENGNLADLKQYCPNWKFIADLAGNLPDRNETLGNLRADAALQTKEAVDGWRLVAKLVREKVKRDTSLATKISSKNDFELVFWLLTVRV
ncbi:MAG: hypothetical protein Q8N98_02105, partial [bacterium]|nr:hypothetical protein [bacterium]